MSSVLSDFVEKNQCATMTPFVAGAWKIVWGAVLDKKLMISYLGHSVIRLFFIYVCVHI